MNNGITFKTLLQILRILNIYECIETAYRIYLCYLEHEGRVCDKSLPNKYMKFQAKIKLKFMD